jgi:hypothetical protein
MIQARGVLFAVVGGCLLTAVRAGASDAPPMSPAPLASVGAPPCLAAPPCQADHVYVFLMNGVDPFHFGEMPQMRDYLRGLGYCHVYYAELAGGPRFCKTIRRIHADDPNGRIVLVGYSLAANEMSLVTRALKADCIQVDLLVYLGAVLVYNGPLARPDNALRVVNIRDSGLLSPMTCGLARGTAVDGADNVELPGLVFHYRTPANPILREVLAKELAAVACPSPP